MNVLITAGPTREPIDPVRFLSNRSSGKMAYALTEVLLEAGHNITLIAGPTSISPPKEASVTPVMTAQEMFDAVQKNLTGIDIAIHCAAVSDYRPKKYAPQKIKKHATNLSLELEHTPDILGSMRSPFGFKGFLVGFAAETQNVLENAFTKLHAKKCDLLIANNVSQDDIGFESDENAVTLCYPNGNIKSLPQATKRKIAQKIVHEILHAIA